MTYSTRRAPGKMSPEEARRALSGLVPLLQELLDAAYPEGLPDSVGHDGNAMTIPGAETLFESHRFRPRAGRGETD